MVMPNSFDQFYGVKRVSAEIGGECCGFGYLTFVYAELVDDDCFYAICNFRHSCNVYNVSE